MLLRAAMAPSTSPFFFQAEDGIRDGHVTGVQTCALPISSLAWLVLVSKDLCEHMTLQRRVRVAQAIFLRSEERRVGKECRLRRARGYDRRRQNDHPIVVTIAAHARGDSIYALRRLAILSQ